MLGDWQRLLLLLASLSCRSGCCHCAHRSRMKHGKRLICARRGQQAARRAFRSSSRLRASIGPGCRPQGAADGAEMPKPRELNVQTRLIFHERIVPVGPPGSCVRRRRAETRMPGSGGSLKVVRHVVQAAAAINGEVRPTAATLRPEVALLVAEKRDRGWPVVVFSPAGPLSWSELELVQVVGDPLALADLLPAQPVAVGDRWKVREMAVKVVSGYDTVTSSNLEATLESADAARHASG